MGEREHFSAGKSPSGRVAVFKILLLLCLLLGAGCASQLVSLREVGQEGFIADYGKSALTTGSFSASTDVVLERNALRKKYDSDPAEAVRLLAEAARTDHRPDMLVALAEMCFLAARDQESRWFGSGRWRTEDLYLAAAVCSEMWLMGPGHKLANPYSADFRVTRGIHCLSLSKAFSDGRGRLVFEGGARETPIGRVDVRIDYDDSGFDGSDYEKFLPCDTRTIKGFEVHNRSYGMGSPFLAVYKKSEDKPFRSTAAGGTIFLRMEPTPRHLPAPGEPLAASLVTVDTEKTTRISVDGREWPVEADFSMPLAYTLDNPALWRIGMEIFRLGRTSVKPGIYMARPYDPEKIPVLFVHGTMSSPLVWAKMWNTLHADPELRHNYQLWFYFYDSADFLMYSARNLQDRLREMLRKVDPSGGSRAVRNMMVIGHSQGGLLVKLLATDTGDSLVRASGAHVEMDKLDDDERAFMERYLVFKPVPQVRDVVFISTPHRGSFMAFSLARFVARSLISLPKGAVELNRKLAMMRERMRMPGVMNVDIPTSIDSMSPENKLLLTLADIPVSGGVTAHSVIAIDGDDKPPKGDDGVVEYKSAHVPYVESERVVRCDHSAQLNPVAIDEVRRIMLEHMAKFRAAPPAPAAKSPAPKAAPAAKKGAAKKSGPAAPAGTDRLTK